MDRLVDHLFVFEGEGVIRDFPGNYSQYRENLEKEESGKTPAPATQETVTTPRSRTRQQLSFGEKRELEQLEKDIASLTREKAEVTEKLHSGTVPFNELEKLSVRIGLISVELDEKELRWLELSELA
jgi:ATP-binding cassette subfamily F protein uup